MGSKEVFEVGDKDKRQLEKKGKWEKIIKMAREEQM